MRKPYRQALKAIQQLTKEELLTLRDTITECIEGGYRPDTLGYEEIKTIKGHKYRYRRWRDGDILRSQYIGKVEE